MLWQDSKVKIGKWISISIRGYLFSSMESIYVLESTLSPPRSNRKGLAFGFYLTPLHTEIHAWWIVFSSKLEGSKHLFVLCSLIFYLDHSNLKSGLSMTISHSLSCGTKAKLWNFLCPKALYIHTYTIFFSSTLYIIQIFQFLSLLYFPSALSFNKEGENA